LPSGDTPLPDIAKKRNTEGKIIRSQVLTIINGKTLSSHIKDNVNFLIDVGEPDSNVDEPTPAPISSSSTSSSTTVVTIIVVAVIVLCLVAIAFLYFQSRRMRPFDFRSRQPIRSVNMGQKAPAVTKLFQN